MKKINKDNSTTSKSFPSKKMKIKIIQPQVEAFLQNQCSHKKKHFSPVGLDCPVQPIGPGAQVQPEVLILPDVNNVIKYILTFAAAPGLEGILCQGHWQL